MQFQIITFGNGEILEGVLNAIAMCLNSQTGTLYIPLIRIGMMFAVLWAAIYSIWGDYLRAWGRATILFVLIPPLLFVPSTRVHVHDVISNYQNDVENVPYGLAYVAHFVSKIGFEVTKQVDRVFSNVDDLTYHKSGFLMASNLIQQARTFRIVNEDVAENMRQFVCQCVAYEAMLGYKYTIEDLRHTDDIWKLVSTNASRIRSFVWRQPHRPGARGNPPEIISCAEGVKKFNLLWGEELDRGKTVFGKKMFGPLNPQTAKREFLKYLPLSYTFLTDISKSTNEILKQQMMIYSMVDGIEQKSTALGNTPNFAARRAYLQQRTTYETLGSMASESLMTMKAVLEAIVYASFIFLVPLAVLPFGVRVLLSWVQTLLWLQMWAPLYAVLNFIMSMSARSKSIEMLSTSNPEGITIASSLGLTNLNADMSAMAGYLAMSIPFLAIALVKGVGSFVHMASHLGNVSQGAAAQAAGEAATGNYSFGNVSEGNQQIANTNMLSQSRAASYRAGAFQLVDGRTDMTTMADGSQIANVGVSNLPVVVSGAETETAQQTEMAAKTYQNGISHSENSAKHLASSYKDMVNLSKHLGQSQSMNDGMSQGISAEQSKDIQKGTQLIEKFAKDNNITVEKGAEALATVSIGKDGFFVSGAMKASTSSADREIYQKAAEFSKNENFHEAMKSASQASQNVSHNLSDEESKKLAIDVAGSYEKGMHERSEAAKSFSQSDSWSQQAMNTRANAASINANYNQQFLEWLADQPADHTNGHIGHRGAAYIIANNPNEAMAYANKFMTQQGLIPQASLHTNPNQVQSDYQAETGHQRYKATQNSLNEVKQQGAVEFTNDLSSRGAKFRERTDQSMNANNQAIVQGSSGLSQEGSKVKEKVEAQQGQTVTGRVVRKVAKEGRETVNNLRNLDEKVSSDLSKISGGEPQQK